MVAAFVILLSVTLAVAGTQVYVSTKHRLVDELDLDLSLAANQASAASGETERPLCLPGGRGAAARLSRGQGHGDLGAVAGRRPVGPRWASTFRRASVDRPRRSPRAIAGARLAGSGSAHHRRRTARSSGWVQAVRSLRPVEDALSALATQLYIILPLAVLIAAVASYFLAGQGA